MGKERGDRRGKWYKQTQNERKERGGEFQKKSEKL
jgi:hypothetical protein